MATTQNGIYYPADGTKAATILEDMKKMAESVDKIVQEEKENEETMGQDIQNIKSEQVTQNTKLQELDDNQIHITTERASNLNVQDASGQNAKINVFGISSQKTRKGINLTNYEDWERITAYGSLEQEEDKLIYNITNGGYGIRDIERTLKANTNYTACVDFKFTGDFGSQYGLRVDVNGSITSLKTDGLVNFTTDETGKATMQFYVGFPYDGEYATLTVSNIKLYEGTYTKENIPDYEQYGVSPSPKYPSEIENTTGNVKIMDYNKNFLGIEDLNHTSAGLNWQITDNEVKITGTTTAVYSTSNEIECFIPAGSYKFLAVNGASNLTYRIWLYNSKNELLKYPMSEEQFTLTENAVKYRLVFDNLTVGNTYNTTFNPMILLQTETDEEFEAHEEEVITFPLQNQKMFEGSYLANNGMHHKRKQIELDGTETVIDSGYNETTHHFTIRPTDKAFGQMEILSNMFVNSTEATKVYSVVGNNSNADIIFKMPLEYATVDSFKTFLAQQKQAGTPVIVEYPLSEEEVEEYTEEQQTQRDQLQNAKTYKTVTNVFTDNAEVEMNYIADTKTYVDNKYNSLAQQILEIVGGN